VPLLAGNIIVPKDFWDPPRSHNCTGTTHHMAEQTAQRLLDALSTLDKPETDPSTPSLQQWNDDLENDLLSASPEVQEEGPLLLNEAAHKLHSSLLAAVDSSLSRDDQWSDEDASDASRKAVNAVSEAVASNRESDFSILADLLRAAGLFMRWHQTLQSTTLLDPSNNPTARLKSEGMLLLCSKLLEIDLPKKFPDVPRFASIYIFRATYGNDEVTTAARKTFVDSLDGCICLVKALIRGDQPLSRIFSVVRNVHHLISAHPASIAKMNKAVQMLTDESPEKDTKHDLLEVLVATMSWAIRSEPVFPGESSDRRSELVLEILRALFAMDAGVSSKTQYLQETMTQLGIILCELLKLSSSDARVYQCKLAVVALLLNAPNEYAEYLATTGGITQLVEILAYQLSVVVIERTDSGAEDAAAVVPILLVLQKLSQASPTVLKIVKDKVFPPDEESVFQEKVKAEIVNQTEGKVKAKNMAPLDAPKGSLRWKLIRLMTWTESNVKRSGSELLWTLCDDDPTQFVLRTGFGNAVHFLGMKGCVALPKGVDL
jgi:hypothetical protein